MKLSELRVFRPSAPAGEQAMSWLSNGLALLRDERIAPLAVSASPAWLWSLDASRILWANPTGAAIFGAATSSSIAARKFDAGQPAAAQVAQLAATLPADGAPQPVRLRGFGAGIGRALACRCSRIALPDGSEALLIAATERAGPALTLEERLTRLLAGCDWPVAVLSPDGKAMHVSPDARSFVRGEPSLAALGIEATAREALRTGHAAGQSSRGIVRIDRLGADREAVLLAAFAEQSDAEMPATEAPETAVADVEVDAASETIEAAAVETVAAETVALAEPEPVVAPPLAPVATAAAETAPAETIVAAPAQPAPRAAAELPALPFFERRHPLRFVWQIDAEGRFTLGSDEFVAIAGPSTAAVLGHTWAEIAAALDLDPEQRIAQALATRDTWSGLTVVWPIDGSDDRLTIELSGLPSFDRERQFRGYRGFGVCRDIARLNNLARRRSALVPAPVEAAMSAEPDDVPTPAPAEPPVAEPETPTLSTVEHHAFYELSRRLTHLNHDDAALDSAIFESASLLSPAGDMRQLFDRLPVGVMIYRLEELIYANRSFLQTVGYDNLDELIEAGGLDGLLIAPDSNSLEAAPGRPCALTIVDRGGDNRLDVELIPVLWESEAAHALLIPSSTRTTETKAGGQTPDRDEIAAEKLAATKAQAEAAQAHVPAARVDAAGANANAAGVRAEIAELHAILDTATDGVIVLDRAGSILSANRSAEALFGYDARELTGRPLFELFAPESVDLAATYLDSVCQHGSVSMLNSGRDVTGRVRQGGHVKLFMSLGPIGEDGGKLCAVFRDITHWKQVEADLLAAKRQAEKASSAKSELLAKISHEIRTPLNAIIGFSEVMMEERFGPVANERYRDYVKDIHAAGGHLMSLINDLLDLSKIEAGKLELTFDEVSLNDLAQQCVALMQPQANRQRIIIRTSLPPDLPQVIADARSLRQIMLNLLSNSIKFTEAGGQVIVSTALNDDGDVALRVRDSGIGMSEADIATALEPFRQIETTIAGRAGGTGLGLPLTKALAEANRARFQIRSTPKEGTLVEIRFKAVEVPAE